MKNAFIAIGGLLCNLVRGASGGATPQSWDTIPEHSYSRDVVLVLDASPSMRYRDWKPSRLAGAKQAAKAFVTRLLEADPDAHVAIVAYSGRAHVVSRLQPVSNIADIARCIDRISTGWSTNITAGIKAAQKILLNSQCDQHVIVLTDGQHNSGPRPESVARDLRQSAVIECIGMAGTPEAVDRRLADLASTDEFGRRRYRWIGEPEQLVKTFEQLATGLARQ